MENKALDFVRNFNSDREEDLLGYISSGYSEGIVLSEIYLWDDNNHTTEHLETITLSRLYSQISELQEITNEKLAVEVDKFFARKTKELKEKFTYAKLKYLRIANCAYGVYISGAYNEDAMSDFMNILLEDFRYIFEGLKIEGEC